MRRFSGKRCLVVCDCEGYETEIFTDESLPDTAKWDLIIELHGTSAEEKLPALFSRSHDVLVIEAERRRVEDYPMLEGIVRNPNAAISENRPLPSYWLSARSKVAVTQSRFS
jgi:hypothetical protein